LKEQSDVFQANIKRLEGKRFEALQKNNITEKILRQFTVTRKNFLNIGVNLAELPQYNDALAEIKRLGFDAKKILFDLQESENLQDVIEANGKYLIKCNNDIKIAKEQLHKISSELKTTEYQYRQYSYAIRVIFEFVNKGQDASTIISWNQILQQCKMSILEFDSELKKFGSMTTLIHKINDEIKPLEKQKAHLKSTISGFDTECKELSEMIALAQTKLDEKIARCAKEINAMHANPLQLVKESRELKEVLPVLSIFLKEMSIWLKKYGIDDKDIARSVETLVSKMDGIVSGK
jgi:predicted  nucleic acid-binding Zn-ribbon protein